MTPFQRCSYISILFALWKSLILVITTLAPGPGYDTSTTLLPSTSKLVRWDAIYYIQITQRGHIFEQDWAFGKGLSSLLAAFSHGHLDTTIIAGVLLAHISHYISVILLWRIASSLSSQPGNGGKESTVPFIAACLHVITPAGVFLSAPYSEGPFACLSMLGFWLYVQAWTSDTRTSTALRCLSLIASGISFGCATFIRSNGVLSGLPFLFDAVRLGLQTLQKISPPSTVASQLLLLASTILSGLCIAAGLVLPQYLAYKDYCIPGHSQRPWCNKALPLIYGFVQSHYWGVGFLRYWTLSNVPLFLLATPCLILLLASSVGAFTSSAPNIARRSMLIRSLAVPQAVLACLAITNYHVQIITRLCSGYPWLYIWLAEKLQSRWKYGQVSVRFFVVYGLIQAGLFASFLPPA